MIDESALCAGLQKLLATTEADIRARIEEEPALKQAIEARHKAAAEAGRTAPGAWLAFRDEAVTQAAVHWLLGCVFVRFLEDNDLVDEVWISGPKTTERDRLNEALDRRSLWYQQNQHGNDADFLLDVFARTAELPGMSGLFDRTHNPLWSLEPTGPQAMAILQFFQARDEATSELRYDFTDPDWNTRFLGDLYENLSEFARKRYALCQTPGFVADFILDRTLNPALDAFGLERTRLIDPTCGSGHFLLAAFDRLFAMWVDREPNENVRVLAQRALDAVYGVDLNPFAVEIAEFRLLVAALRACGSKRLREAPNFTFQLAAGDSLLHGRLLGRERGIQYPMGHDPASHFFTAENSDALERILGQRYEAVVGNPPYINVEDAVLRKTYRDRYGSCHGKYQLSVPFVERLFNLTTTEPPGFVGFIVANGFMKREFGRVLVEDYLPRWDLTHFVDTSGAFIPGHATATAILLGRQRPPMSEIVRAVRGIRAEKREPKDPALAPVWTAIAAQVDQPESTSNWVSVTDVPRAGFSKHPWSVGGGGAAELRDQVEEARSSTLKKAGYDIGIQVVTLEDEIFFRPPHALKRCGVTELKSFGSGEDLRDWMATSEFAALFPYDSTGEPALSLPTRRHLWPWRTGMSRRIFFGQTQVSRSLHWWEYGAVMWKRVGIACVAYGEIATHNHFVFDRGGRVFKQTAPVIRLSEKTNEEDHIGLIGLLNSSTGGFWLKQVCYSKGTGGNGRGLATESWEQGYCFNGTNVEEFPIPIRRPLKFALSVQSEVNSRALLLPHRRLDADLPTYALLADARTRAAAHLGRMIAFQEELDWQVYHLYGLLDEDLSLRPEEVPPLKLGERHFEIVMARQIAAG